MAGSSLPRLAIYSAPLSPPFRHAYMYFFLIAPCSDLKSRQGPLPAPSRSRCGAALQPGLAVPEGGKTTCVLTFVPRSAGAHDLARPSPRITDLHSQLLPAPAGRSPVRAFRGLRPPCLSPCMKTNPAGIPAPAGCGSAQTSPAPPPPAPSSPRGRCGRGGCGRGGRAAALPPWPGRRRSRKSPARRGRGDLFILTSRTVIDFPFFAPSPRPGRGQRGPSAART